MSAKVVLRMPIGSGVWVILIVSSISDITAHPSGVANRVVPEKPEKRSLVTSMLVPLALSLPPVRIVWLLIPLEFAGPRVCV